MEREQLALPDPLAMMVLRESMVMKVQQERPVLLVLRGQLALVEETLAQLVLPELPGQLVLLDQLVRQELQVLPELTPLLLAQLGLRELLELPEPLDRGLPEPLVLRVLQGQQAPLEPLVLLETKVLQE